MASSQASIPPTKPKDCGNMLEETRRLTARMTQRQRFEKAHRHLMDALRYEYPRNDLDMGTVSHYTVQPRLVKFSYNVQTSTLWSYFMSVLAFVYMYLIAFEPNNRLDLDVPLSVPTLLLNNLILVVMIADLVMQVIHKNRWETKQRKKYNFRFWAKAAFLFLFVVDHLIFYTLYSSYPLRPFRILRAFMIYFYSHSCRKTLNSLWGAAQDILAFVVFFMFIITIFGIASAHIIDIPENTVYDPLSQNFGQIRTSVFLMYVLSTYDAWPDLEMPVLNVSSWYYAFFITFMFLNMLYFITIPVTFIFASFRRTRSKIMLLDEVKQQNSLLLCFACLADQATSVNVSTFQQFMMFAYRWKLRYAQRASDLSVRLDPNNNGRIEFLKLGKYLEENCQFKPPPFDDWQWFVKLRSKLNPLLKLDQIVRSDRYEIVVAVIVTTNVTIVVASLFVQLTFYHALEIGFTCFYLVEFLVRFIGQGPEKMFKESRSWLDVVILMLSIFLLLADSLYNDTLMKFVRLASTLRINRLVRILWRSTFFRRRIYMSSFYRKLRLLFTQLYICALVGLRMFPLILTCFYTVSILGMEGFDNRFAPVPSPTNYSTYDAYSSFRSLLQSHLLCVQFMIESSWSYITLDYAVRYDNFAGAVAFFSFVHFYLVLVLISLMKGMAADFYNAINEKHDELVAVEIGIIERQELETQRRLKDEEITRTVMEGRILTQDTIRKKQFAEHKLNRDMIQALIKMLKERSQIKRKRARTVLLLQHPEANDIRSTCKTNKSFRSRSHRSSGTFDNGDSLENIPQQQKNINLTSEQLIRRVDSNIEIEVVEAAGAESDADLMEGAFLDKIKLEKDSTPMSLFPLYPSFLRKFIDVKFKCVSRADFDKDVELEAVVMNFNNLASSIIIDREDLIGVGSQATKVYTNGVAALLGVQRHEESRRKTLQQDILKLKLSDPEQIAHYTKQTCSPCEEVELDAVLRSVYLGDLNPTLVSRFQDEYFSDCYGNSYRRLNKAITAPMLRQQALILSSLTKILRYPAIATDAFFSVLAAIEYKVSNESILRSGSIFKLLFQVDELGENWFAVEIDKSHQVRLHFLKSSIWVYHPHMQPNKILYAHDIFAYNPDEFMGEQDCQKIVRLLYNSFESIGFSTLGGQEFFQTDPNNYVYDLYTLLLPVGEEHYPPQPKLGLFNLKITNIMLVMLVKEDERAQRLKYPLTSLESLLRERQSRLEKEDFKLEDDNHETLEKLQSMETDDAKKISNAASLPHAYLVDTMISFQEILESKKHNLVRKAEEVLNSEFDRLSKDNS